MASVEIQVQDRIARITFNRPDALNALNLETIQAFSDAVKDLSARKDVSVILLTGSGDKAFIAGADIKQMSEMNSLDASRFSKMGQEALFALENAPQITIAAVNGFALGGGCEVAMACDLIYASEKAKFGQPEVNLGVMPGFGGTQRLLRLVGPMKAREMILTGKMISAAEAKDIGLVAEVFAPERLLETVQEVAKQILSKGPEAIRRSKAVLRDGMDMDLPRACALERENFAICFSDEDQKEGMAAFLEKRAPAFKG